MRRNNSINSDISFSVLLMLFFICFIFLINVSEDKTINLIIIAIIFAMLIITYFSNITVSLIINFIGIFGYASYIVFQSLGRGIAIQPYSYFWMIMSPLLCVCLSIFAESTLKMERDIKELKTSLNALAMIDADTSLKNLKAYVYDADLYAHIANRYKISVALLVFEPRFKNDIEKMVGTEKMNTYLTRIIEAIQSKLRNEDELYVLDGEEYIFGILLLTKFEAKDVVIERIKKAISEPEKMRRRQKKKVKVDIRVGIAKYDSENMSPLDLLEKAKSELQYDVL